MISEVFKIFKSFDDTKYRQFSLCQIPELRGHKFKIYKPQVHFDKYFFSVRVTEEWNSLPVKLINCNTVESFLKKNCLLL